MAGTCNVRLQVREDDQQLELFHDVDTLKFTGMNPARAGSWRPSRTCVIPQDQVQPLGTFGCALHDESDALDNAGVSLKLVITLDNTIPRWIVIASPRQRRQRRIHLRGKTRPVSSSNIMDNSSTSSFLGTTGLAPESPTNRNRDRPRRRSALAIAERVTGLVSLRRGSLTTQSRSRSRSRATQDSVSPQSPTGLSLNSMRSASSSTLHLPAAQFFGGGRSTRPSRDNSACTTDREDDRESTSEDFHSMEDSLEFGLLEGDPFANLSAPPSQCNSPASRMWLKALSSDVITEEPEEREDCIGKQQQPPQPLFGDTTIHQRRTEALVNFGDDSEPWIDGGEDSDGEISVDSHMPPRVPVSSPQNEFDIPERRRSNSFTQRVRNIVQSRPSLPSLSILANTKIFIPAASPKVGLASRFPSEPWDDPKWSVSGTKLVNGDLNVVTTPSRGTDGSSSGGGGGWSGDRARNDGRSGGYGSRARDFSSRSTDQFGSGDGGDGDGWRPPRRGGPISRSATEENTSDDESDEDSDDVPLGQRPNALSAQKSLRTKIKDERRTRKETLKQAARSLLPGSSAPSKPTKAPAPVKLSADDLTARLLHLRANADSLPTSPTGRTAFPTLQTKSPAGFPGDSSPHLQRSPVYETFPTAHQAPSGLSSPPSRTEMVSAPAPVQPSSFAFPSRNAMPTSPPPMRRHATESRAHGYRAPSTPDTARPRFPERSMTSFDSPRGNGPSGSASGSRPSREAPRKSHDSSMHAPPPRTRADTLIQKLGSPSNYVAKVRQRANSLHQPSSSSSARAQAQASAPALPPLPQPAAAAAHPKASLDYGSGMGHQGHPETMMQQRMFIGNMQRFSVVEIGARTNAREVLADIVAKGDLSPEEVRSADWMLFEVANDFGMERPIREFEIVMEIYNSWNSETRVNYFMLKPTRLAPQLAASAIPKSSPTFGGYVEWEYKRGKWTKRWLELREHSLWISKRQGNKDAVVICTLANFDAYTVTRVHKSPKPFIFSVKSVQNMRMFENISDYHHVFSCDATDGAQWLQHILLARSYVLHQERAVLFRALNAPPAGAVTRAPTKRGPPAPLLLFDPSKPLPQQSSQMQSPASNAVDGFNPIPGSLLSKRI